MHTNQHWKWQWQQLSFAFLIVVWLQHLFISYVSDAVSDRNHSAMYGISMLCIALFACFSEKRFHWEKLHEQLTI